VQVMVMLQEIKVDQPLLHRSLRSDDDETQTAVLRVVTNLWNVMHCNLPEKANPASADLDETEKLNHKSVEAESATIDAPAMILEEQRET
jgi:hypothetical protein